MPGKVRRHIDARLVSYAMNLARGSKRNQDVAMVAQTCAVAALQGTSGMAALVQTCRAAATSPAATRGMDPQQAHMFRQFFESVAYSVSQSWMGELQELVEMVVVLSSQIPVSQDDSDRILAWSQGAGIDISPLAVDDSDVSGQETVLPQEFEPRKRHPRRRNNPAKSSYRKNRLEDLVKKAICAGVQQTRARIVNSRVEIVGTSGRTDSVHIGWVRGSMRDANTLCDQINTEIDASEELQ